MSIHLITLICQLTDGLCKEAEADAASVQFAERGGVAGWKRSAAPECASSKVCHSVLSADGNGDDANLPPRTEEAKRKKTLQIRTTQSHTSLKFWRWRSEVKWSEVKWGGVIQHKSWVAVDSVSKKNLQIEVNWTEAVTAAKCYYARTKKTAAASVSKRKKGVKEARSWVDSSVKSN